MSVVFDYLEGFAFGPEVETVGFTDHKGIFDGIMLTIECLFGIAGAAVQHMDAIANGVTTGTTVLHFMLAIAAGKFISNHENNK